MNKCLWDELGHSYLTADPMLTPEIEEREVELVQLAGGDNYDVRVDRYYQCARLWWFEHGGRVPSYWRRP